MSGAGWLDAIGEAHAPDPRLDVWEAELVSRDGTDVVEGVTTVAAAIEQAQEEAQSRGARVLMRALPDDDLGDRVRAIAYRSLAYLRREPSHASEMVSQIVMGEEALVLRRQGRWLQVRTADRYVSWVHEGACILSDVDDAKRFEGRLLAGDAPEGSALVAAERTVCRAGPAPDAPIVSDLVQGAIVRAGEPTDGWTEITLPDGTEGWLPETSVVSAARRHRAFPATGASIVAHAERFLGLPYMWGGTSEKGFDCSGLTQRLYGLRGIRLPRDSDQQSEIGEGVDPGAAWENVGDGDLAFFAEGGERVTHVGIVQAGGRMIHASTTRNGVAWDALNPDDPLHTPYGARLSEWLTGIRRVLPT